MAEVEIDLVADWHREIYRWFVDNCRVAKWKFANLRNKNLSDAIARNDFESASENDRRALASYYFNLQHRIVSRRRRKLEVQTEEELFANIPESLREKMREGWAAFCREVVDGEDLSLRQTVNRFEIDGKDVLLDRLRIHHFHIQEIPKKRGDFVAYCFVSDDIVKVIALETHRAFNMPELCQSVLERAYCLYPEEFSVFLIRAETSCGGVSLEEQKKLAWLNCNVPFVAAGRLFFPIGIGVMTNGVSAEAQMRMIKTSQLLKSAEKEMISLFRSCQGDEERRGLDVPDKIVMRLHRVTNSTVDARSEDGSIQATYDAGAQRVELLYGERLLQL